MRFVFVNSGESTIRAFKKGILEISTAISGRVTVDCFHGNLQQFVMTLKRSSDQKVAILSPANSLCLMGAGFDRAIAELFTTPGGDYRDFEAVVQNYTLSKYNGFIPPQAASIVGLKQAFENSNQKFDDLGTNVTHLIQTPTMAVPERITSTTVFYCMWNTLLACNDDFDTVIIPAIGAGYGGLPVPIAVRTICGALGIFYMNMQSSLSRGAAILLFLKKDIKAFANGQDIAKIEQSFRREQYNHIQRKKLWVNTENRELDEPLEWPEFYQCINSLG
ncbi:hypothetical protein OXX69_004153 [Metschnikowia pulcherrima]